MRPIKFRGWHVPQKRMFSAEKMAEDQLTLLTTGQFINVHGQSTKLSTIFPTDVFIPLQYTGRHDKNGVEIYGGDIVLGKYKEYSRDIDGWGKELHSCPNCHPQKEPRMVFQKYTVEYGNGGFFLQRQPVHGKFDFDYNDEIEVIGNIYEHKYLLGNNS